MTYPVLFACAIGLIGNLSAQVLLPPASPSNLKVTALGVNSFLMEWKDNSVNEKGWDIRVSLGTVANPARFLLLPVANLTSYVVITNELPGDTLSFRLAAYNGDSGFESFSGYTSVVTAKAAASSSFHAPTNFTAVAINDGSMRLGWDDNATSETGYQVEFKTGGGEWQLLDNFNPALNFSFPVAGLEPTTTYSFRVRGFKGNPIVYTPYSNIATDTTLAFQAPSNLVAKAEGEGKISLKWKDRSAVEEGYEIQSRVGTNEFVSLGTTGPNVIATDPISGHDVDTTYDFRIRGFRTENSVKVYTDFADTASVTTSSLIKPANLTGEVIDDTTLRLNWDDRSELETGFQVEAREVGTPDYRVLGTLPANKESVKLARFDPGVLYEIRVRAIKLQSASGYTTPIQLRTKDGITGDLNPPVFRGTSFSHEIGISRPPKLVSLSVTNLPDGLTYDADTRTISGTTNREGVKTVKLRAKFADDWVVNRNLVLRIVRPPAAPIANSSFADVEVAPLATIPVSFVGKFSDPDTAEARRVTTTKGNFDIILYPLATPETVENFLKYAESGSYDGSFFHRAPADFVVQGGGYLHSGSEFSKIATFPSVKNEPGISNLAGTVAMAKTPGDPDSATSEFFVNVNDSNASNLDYQNGGFTVFGRVAGTGMNVVNQISDLPRGDYTVTVGGSSKTLEDVPMNDVTAPVAMDASLLVKVSSVAAVPILRYEVLSEDVAVATAVLNGNNVDITGVAEGATTVTLKAIDLDGQMVSQTIAVTVAPIP